MLELDHLVIVAPSLKDGAAHVRQQLGIEMPPGGEHPQMGTHNLLLKLGEGTFLEVIAINPAAPPIARTRWFAMDNAAQIQSDWAEGRRLRAWVARSNDLDPILVKFAHLFGDRVRVSRGDRNWDFVLRTDGALTEGGALPALISWGLRGPPAATMGDSGVRLVGFTIEHPDPDRIAALYRTLNISGAPLLKEGPEMRMVATLETPNGLRELS